jgi:hypothetical protein
VVLVGERGAEERHRAVAGELVDGPLEAVDALADQAVEAVHDLAPHLAVDALGEIHRALHVGEQDRHLLALAAQRRRRGGDPVGEVRGRVAARIRHRRRRPLLLEPLSATVAEALAARVVSAALRAGDRRLERRTAGAAESRRVGVVGSALRAGQRCVPAGCSRSSATGVAVSMDRLRGPSGPSATRAPAVPFDVATIGPWQPSAR